MSVGVELKIKILKNKIYTLNMIANVYLLQHHLKLKFVCNVFALKTFLYFMFLASEEVHKISLEHDTRKQLFPNWKNQLPSLFELPSLCII